MPLSVVGVGAVALSLVAVLVDAVAQVVVLLLAVGGEALWLMVPERKASSTWPLGGAHCAGPGCA